MIEAQDTIAAVATPAGTGGIGMVRISGPGTPGICRAVFRPADPSRWERRPPHARASFGLLVDPDGEPLDRGYVTYFRSPRSYTGEDTAEITVHGSPFVLGRLLDTALRAGARTAEPGEFTYRAFLNGRLDLAQAEAVSELIAARTAHQARVAFEQAEGSLARVLAPARNQLVELVARMEAALEFPEEDGTGMRRHEVVVLLDAIRDGVDALAASYEHGRVVRHGATAVLAGAANVGKSSLFNRLIGSPRAIVTEVAGTTRDLLSESVELEGIPLRLVDTAGLGLPSDPIVAEGMRRAEEARRGAEVVVFVADRSRPMQPRELEWLAASPPNTLVVLNKCDLPPARDAGWGRQQQPGRRRLETSALTGQGIDDLRRELAGALGAEGGGDVPVTRRRQRDELLRCSASLDRAQDAVRTGRGEEEILVDLHEARRYLGRVTGHVDMEAIYDRVFSSFCIGK